MRNEGQQHRRALSLSLGISDRWATVDQVHGCDVIEAVSTGNNGVGDALFTARPGLPVAVFTADCAAVVVHSPTAVGVAHAGWRGAAAGIVRRLIEAMADGGHEPTSISVGPAIGPCCFEVGQDVLAAFPDHQATTSWGAPSVDLTEAVLAQAAVSDRWAADECTRCGDGFYSHRATSTLDRMAAVAWLQ